MNEFSLSFTPLLPVALLWGFAALAVLVTALGFWQRRSGTILRAIGLALVLVALLDPALVRENKQPLKDVVAVVVDQSGSNTIGERPTQTEKAKEELVKRLKALGNVDVRVIEIEPQRYGRQWHAALHRAERRAFRRAVRADRRRLYDYGRRRPRHSDRCCGARLQGAVACPHHRP